MKKIAIIADAWKRHVNYSWILDARIIYRNKILMLK